MLNRLSIQKQLSLLMVALLALLLISSLVIWFSFSRIEASQNSLLNDSIPTIHFVNEAIGTGLEFIDLGTSIQAVKTDSDLQKVESKVQVLFKRIEMDLTRIQEVDKDELEVLALKNNVQGLANNVDKQIELKWHRLDDINALDRALVVFNDYIKKTLIQLKLASFNLSTQKKYQARDDDHKYNDVLFEIRFNVLQLQSLVDNAGDIDSVERLIENDAEARAHLRKIAHIFLGLDESSREKLAPLLEPMNDHFVLEDNVFSLARKIIVAGKELQEIQLDSLAIAARLNDIYSSISKGVNSTLGLKAKGTLGLVSNSKFVIYATAFLSFLYIYILSVFFVKPMLVDRIERLSLGAREIADGKYEEEIEVKGFDEISELAKSLEYFRGQLIDKDIINERLAIQDKTLVSIVDNTFEGLFSVGLDGEVVLANPALKQIFKVDDNIVGQKIERLLPDDKALFDCHVSDTLVYEDYLVCKEKAIVGINFKNEKFVGSLSIILTNLPAGKMYLCFLRDISEEHNTRARINLLIEQLMQSNSDLEQFAYSCSHDLQEPVRTIQSFAELLKKNIGDSLDEQSLRYLDFIDKGAKQAKNLIKEMLDYSRLDQTSMSRSWVTLGEICKYVNDVTIINREECKGELCWENGDEQLFVMTSLLQRLIVNLVTNGFKYNKSEAKKVTISCSSDTNSWLLCVEDNGIGIDAKYSKKIFEVFKRLVTRREYEGSGIGLSICQKIAEKHGGKIWVESEVGKGSQFYVSLPKNDFGQE